MEESRLLAIEERINSISQIMTDLNVSVRFKKIINLWIQLLKEVWHELFGSASITSIELENRIVVQLMNGLCHIEETTFHALGLTSVCSNKSQLFQRLWKIHTYNCNVILAWCLVRFWIGVINKAPEDIMGKFIYDIRQRLQKFTGMEWLNAFAFLCHMGSCKLTKKCIELLPQFSLPMLCSYSINGDTEIDRNNPIDVWYSASMMCGFEEINDFLFHWKDEKNKGKILNIFTKITKRLENQFEGSKEYCFNVDELLKHLYSTEKSDARHLMTKLCRTHITEARPWWLDIIYDTSTDEPTEPVEEDQSSIEENKTSSSEPSSKSKQKHLHDRMSLDDSVTTKETIIYHSKLHLNEGPIPNVKFCDYFYMKKKRVPQVSLVEGTNMTECKWYHARVYDYSVLDNTWQFRCIVIKMICKVNMGTGAKGSFRDLFEAQMADKDVPRAIKRYRRLVNHRMWKYTADIRCQTLGKYYGDLFTNKYGDKYRIEVATAAFIQVFEDATCRKVIDFFNVEFRAPSDWKFLKFTNNSSFVNKETNSDLATAFGHFTFLESEHKLIIVDLQGWSDVDTNGNEVLYLTDPAIHAPMWEWTDFVGGNTNGGEEGFRIFWKKQHAKCNEICKQLGLERPRNY